MIFFTADTHFGHANIIRYCNRPFATVEEMNETLLANINARVKARDILYHLGDFAFRGANAAAYRSRIACRRVVLVLGNHDPQRADGQAKPDFAKLFSEVHLLLRLKLPVGGKPQLIVLCHYAMRVWDKAHYGAWHLYGHSHGTLSDDGSSLSCDVGMDAHAFHPLSLNEVAAIMSRKSFQPVDHHRPRSPADF